MCQCFLQYSGSDWIVRGQKTIVHPTPLTPRGHNAGTAEIRQMSRDLWLAGPEDFHKIADANFPVGDEVEQAKPRTVCQDTKE
jgi:hypothetical protein